MTSEGMLKLYDLEHKIIKEQKSELAKNDKFYKEALLIIYKCIDEQISCHKVTRNIDWDSPDSIFKFDFSINTLNTLCRNGISKISMLENLTEKYLLNCKGVGKATITDIKRILNSLGKSLKEADK